MVTSDSSVSGGAGASAKASRFAANVADSPIVEIGVRAGYVVNGILHLLIAWLALQVAFGRRGAKADPAGAMALVADSTMGLIVLIAIVVAFLLLGLWQVAQIVIVRETGDRVKAGAKALAYLALAWSAVSLLMGAGTSGSAQAEDATATIMDLPFGVALVVVLGLTVAGVGGYHIYKGWTEGFRRDLEGSPSRFTVLAGKIGYIARGVAFIAVGLGLVTAGVTHSPSESQGLDGALNSMMSLPWGPVLVVLVAAGFAAFGVYSFSRARRART